jgi:hypothetical protein
MIESLGMLAYELLNTDATASVSKSRYPLPIP